MFQNYALYPHMTVAENLAFGLKLRHTSKPEIKRRVDEAAGRELETENAFLNKTTAYFAKDYR